jgi:hypothetical protein
MAPTPAAILRQVIKVSTVNIANFLVNKFTIFVG